MHITGRRHNPTGEHNANSRPCGWTLSRDALSDTEHIRVNYFNQGWAKLLTLSDEALSFGNSRQLYVLVLCPGVKLDVPLFELWRDSARGRENERERQTIGRTEVSKGNVRRQDAEMDTWHQSAAKRGGWGTCLLLELASILLSELWKPRFEGWIDTSPNAMHVERKQGGEREEIAG